MYSIMYVESHFVDMAPAILPAQAGHDGLATLGKLFQQHADQLSYNVVLSTLAFVVCIA